MATVRATALVVLSPLSTWDCLRVAHKLDFELVVDCYTERINVTYLHIHSPNPPRHAYTLSYVHYSAHPSYEALQPESETDTGARTITAQINVPL